MYYYLGNKDKKYCVMYSNKTNEFTIVDVDWFMENYRHIGNAESGFRTYDSYKDKWDDTQRSLEEIFNRHKINEKYTFTIRPIVSKEGLIYIASDYRQCTVNYPVYNIKSLLYRNFSEVHAVVVGDTYHVHTDGKHFELSLESVLGIGKYEGKLMICHYKDSLVTLEFSGFDVISYEEVSRSEYYRRVLLQ